MPCIEVPLETTAFRVASRPTTQQEYNPKPQQRPYEPKDDDIGRGTWGLVHKKTEHCFSSTVPKTMSTFWDYLRPKQKKQRAEQRAEQKYWADRAREEDSAPRKPYTEPVYGTREWHHKNKGRKCVVPMPIHGVHNGRGLGVDLEKSNKRLDSEVWKTMHFMELHKNEELLVKPGVEDLAPYPIYRAAPRNTEGAWPKKEAKPELVPATLNPMKRDSQSMPNIPRGPWHEQPYPANAIDWSPKDQAARNKMVLPGMAPSDAGGYDSSILIKYGFGYNNLKTAHPTDKGTRGGIAIGPYEKKVKKHMRKLQRSKAEPLGRTSNVEIISAKAPTDSMHLRKQSFGRSDPTISEAKLR